MTDWTSGYVTDIGYTHGYYRELNPLHATLPLLGAGVAVPVFGTVCELGFGQGVSINIHAACQPGTEYWGTDFNPVQAACAQSMAHASGSGVRLFEQAFAEFCQRTDLPEFDFIGMHGIWSWISDENRHVIVDFIRRKLKLGGVLYASYNTYPGWAAMAPMRHLLVQHAQVMSAPGQGIAGRIDRAIEFAEKLLATNTAYARANPEVERRMKKMGQERREYLAHEYFHRDWHPMYLADIAECLAQAKLSYVCSANYLSDADALNLSADQQALLADILDPIFRENVRDFMVNRQFRRDYWIKGPRRLLPTEQIDALRRQRVVLAMPRIDVPLKACTSLGEVTVPERIYVPILETLEQHGPKSVAEVEQTIGGNGDIRLAEIVNAISILGSLGVVYLAQDDQVIASAKSCAGRLNAALLNNARVSAGTDFLASPVTGGAITLPHMFRLFLLARIQGRKTPPESAAFVWEVLEEQGGWVSSNGKKLETVNENLAALTELASSAAEHVWPMLQMLGVV